MIKYNDSNINDWNFGSDNIAKAYYNGDICYQKITNGSTPPSPSGLPSGYTEVEYIERDASHNGYVGLGEYFTQDCVIELQFQMTQAKGFAIIGDDFTSDNNDWRIFLNYDTQSNNLLSYDFIRDRKQYNTGNWAKLFHLEVGNYYVIDLDTSTTIISSTPKTNFTRPCQMFLFHLNNVTSSQQNQDYGKIYFIKIWKNNTLVKDLVPCFRNSDNVVGLYDIVGNEFHGSLESTLLAGPTV